MVVMCSEGYSIEVTLNGIESISMPEIEEYIKHIRTRTDKKILSVTLTSKPDDPDHVELTYTIPTEKFEHIRRITGYLSQLDTWNDAKRAEERERVKHI